MPTTADMRHHQTLCVTLLGVRGSTPCAGPNYTTYGGHTSCVMMEADNRVMIFDAGSGLYDANKLINGRNITEYDLFFSHVHLDHIMGLPFFMPIWNKDVTIRIHAGTLKPYGGIQKFLENTFTAPLFPVEFKNFPAQISFHDFEAGEIIHVGDKINIATCPLNHPNGAVGYRTNYIPDMNYEGEKSACYITDTEHPENGFDQTVVDLIRDADLFIYDASYDDKEYPKFKGWGHSTWQVACKLGEVANVKKIGIFHHDPLHTDDKMHIIEQAVLDHCKNAFACRQGMRIVL